MSAIYSAGANTSAQLGLGNTTSPISTHTQVTGDWLDISFGYGFGAGVKSNGTLWAWGDNSYKQLGLSAASYTTPTQVGTDTTWTRVACGYYHTLALRSDGTLWAAGQNTSGQCGTGNLTSPVTTFSQVGTGASWASIAANQSTSYAIKADGTLWAWGENDIYGLLGIGNTTDTYKHTPTQEFTAATTWVAVSTKLTHVVARRSDGTLWGWGRNNYGKLGLGDTTTRDTPTMIGSGATWVVAEAGTDCSYAIKADGTLWACGYGAYYALANGSTSDQYSLIQVGSATDWSLVAGATQSLIAQKTDNSVHVCGRNVFGWLGRGNTTDVTSLTALSLAFVPATLYARGTTSALLVASGDPPEDITLPITIHVGPVADITMPITVVVEEIADIAVPITVHVNTVADITMPITVNVYDPAVFNTAAVATQSGQSWTARVVLDGDDISAHLTGSIEVDAEADAARVATFSLRMVDPFDPAKWLGAAVTVDYVIATTSWRLMTGTVYETQVDTAGGVIRFTCSDERNTVVAAASPSQAEALTPTAYHSSLLSGSKPARGTSYLRQRMTNLAADLDLSPLGQVRVSSWFESSPRKTFTEADIFAGSAGVRVAISPADALADAGAGKIIKVVVEYRYQRLRRARMNVAWSGGGLDPGELVFLPFPEILLDALNGLGEGWKAPSVVFTGANPEWVGAAQKIQLMSARLERRWVQDVTETRTYTVRETGTSPVAPVTSTINVGISVSHDEAAWVDRGEVIQTTEPGSDLVAEANASVRATINAARKDLLTDRRAHSVSFDLPLDPTLDLPYTYGLDTTHITAAGKTDQIRHVMDLDAGSATTTLTLALFGDPTSAVAELGDSNHIIPSLDVLDGAVADLVFPPPAMPTQIIVMPPYGSPPDWDQCGWAVEIHKVLLSSEARTALTEYSIDHGRVRDVTGKILDYRVDLNYSYDVAKSQFRIDVPEIPAEHTDPVDLSLSEDFGMTLPASRFTINT